MAHKEALSLEEVEALDHIFIGPTWRRNFKGKWDLPKHTLGWEIAEWCADYLQAEEGGPWRFTLEQLRFVLWWYAIDDEGRFVYRKGVLQRMKGWGKDPLLAVLCLVELVGPCRFSHWGVDGKPVAKAVPNAWVQVSAVNLSQTTNTMALIPALMSEKLKVTYDIKDGAELIRAKGGTCRLVAVTSNYRKLEGARTTFTLLNETHHWIDANGGHKMYETIDGNSTKAKHGGRYLAITNAYLPNEDSVAEKMRLAWEKMGDNAELLGFLYDSVEANPLTPLTPAALRHVIPIIRGDAVWLDVEGIILSILDPTIPQARSRRMWLNQVVADKDALYDNADWLPLENRDALLQPGDEIVMGFDGGKSDDATALVAIRIKDRTAFVLAIEEKPDGPAGDDWEVNRDLIDSRVRHAHRTFKVRAFFADVALWESYIDTWAEEFGETYSVKATGKHAVAWDMRTSLQTVTRAHERLMRAIYDKNLAHDGDSDLRRHVMNVRRRENNYGTSFGKESRESSKKVDLYAALMLAHEALHNFLIRGSQKRERTGNGWFF